MSSAAYGLEEGEPLAPGLRRAAEGRATKALERLQKDARTDFAGAVHDARKDLKKLRSLLRLTRDSVGEKTYRRENDRLRGAAHSLGAARDAEAKLECLAALREHYGGEYPTRWSRGFVTALEAERDEIAAAEAKAGTAGAVAEIERGLRAIERWKLQPQDDFGLVAPGLLRAYKRGRKRFEEALENPGDEEVHEWRKRVKDLWYQLRLLEPAWPEVVEAMSEEAHELSSILGDHHDLAVVRVEIEARPDAFGGEAQSQLHELTTRRQNELFAEAVPMGRRLYLEKPKRFVARIEGYWEAAQAG